MCPTQYGFQAGKSTLDALIKFSSDVYSELDQSSYLLSIFVDFAKAFDTVPHDVLLRKLEFYGIRGIINEWFGDYLSERSHFTVVDNEKSSSARVSMGVPQGSVLGPVLFLLFVNDLPNFSNVLTSILFADDANIYLTGKDPSKLITTANVELFKLYKWCLANRISMNSIKTLFIMFGNKPPSNLPPLTIKSGSSYEVIKRENKAKFLGVFYDENMTFKAHVNYLVQRLSRTSSLIYQLKDFLPTFALKTIYNAHVASMLNYCNIIWSGAFTSTLLPLIRLTKRIIRNVTHSHFIAHTDPLSIYIVKLLGVHINSQLTWSTHVDAITSKANRCIFMLIQAKKFHFSTDSVLAVYILYIRTALEYAAPVWHSGLTVAEDTQIERIQRRCLRIILGRDYIDYPTALQRLGIQSLSDRRKDLTLRFARGLLRSPDHRDLLPRTMREVHGRETRHGHRLRVPLGQARYQKSAVPYMVRLLNESQFHVHLT